MVCDEVRVSYGIGFSDSITFLIVNSVRFFLPFSQIWFRYHPNTVAEISIQRGKQPCCCWIREEGCLAGAWEHRDRNRCLAKSYQFNGVKKGGENPCIGLSHKVCLIILRRIPGEREILKQLGLLEIWLGVFIHFSFLPFLPSFFPSFPPFLLLSSLLLPLSHLPSFSPSLSAFSHSFYLSRIVR